MHLVHLVPNLQNIVWQS